MTSHPYAGYHPSPQQQQTPYAYNPPPPMQMLNVPFCKCNQPCKLGVCSGSKNPDDKDQEFFACQNSTCRFFTWKDPTHKAKKDAEFKQKPRENPQDSSKLTEILAQLTTNGVILNGIMCQVHKNIEFMEQMENQNYERFQELSNRK